MPNREKAIQLIYFSSDVHYKHFSSDVHYKHVFINTRSHCVHINMSTHMPYRKRGQRVHLVCLCLRLSNCTCEKGLMEKSTQTMPAGVNVQKVGCRLRLSTRTRRGDRSLDVLRVLRPFQV